MQLDSVEGSTFSDEYYLKPMGPMKVNHFETEARWEKVLISDNLQKNG